MSTIAVGDIHGNLAALEDLLDKVLPMLGRKDILVFLGDLIDRGPDPRGCVDRIVQLRKEHLSEVVALIGNHEMWMLESRRDPTRHSWVFTGQGFSTIESYSREAGATLNREIERYGPRLITERISLSYKVFFDILPREHLDFFEKLKFFHQTEDAICVHGGVAPTAARSTSRILWT